MRGEWVGFPIPLQRIQSLHLFSLPNSVMGWLVKHQLRGPKCTVSVSGVIFLVHRNLLAILSVRKETLV